MTFTDYQEAGWSLCAITPGRKAPTYDGWNRAAMPAESIEATGDGAGLLHALSGTCAIDIDDLTAARLWWAEHGVDIDALLAEPDSVHIKSGREGRDKLLYKLKTPLRTFKPKGSGTELRCATAGGESVQDVLPPTIHPITKKPYFWAYGDELVGDWRNLPNIPAKVFAVWRELANDAPVTEVVNTKPQAVDIATVRKAVEVYITSRKIDLDDYDAWVALGMRIHKQTGGSVLQGIPLWDEVSKRSPKYPGLAALKAKWLSFDETGAIGLDAAIRELPASRDEFEDVCEADEVTTEDLIETRNKATIKEARDFLKARLIYVKDFEQYFDRENHRIFRTNFGLEHEFAHKMPRKSGTHVSVVKMLKDLGADKPIVNGIGFHPGEGVIFTERGDQYANVYRPRLPEPLKPTREEQDNIEWLFDRIDDVTYREWLIQFYGHVVQRPGVKIKAAPLIWSETQGNGKTTLVAKIPALLVGSQYSVEMSSDVLGTDFNDELQHAWHVNLSEFSGGSRRENDQVTKKVERWIVEEVFDLHQKGLGAVTIPNHFFLTASSNKPDAASISNDDRKWAIHEMHAPAMTEAQTASLFEGFLKTPRAPGVLRHYFLGVDLTGFNPNARAPVTEAKTEMARENISAELEALTLWFEEHSGPLARDIVNTAEVTADVRRHTPAKYIKVDRVGKWLGKHPFNGISRQIRTGGRGSPKFRVMILRNHDKWATAGEKDVLAYIHSDAVSVESEIDELLL